jgi:hypothetical protein
MMPQKMEIKLILRICRIFSLIPEKYNMIFQRKAARRGMKNNVMMSEMKSQFGSGI